MRLILNARKRAEQGFTLLELIVAISILGLLAAIAIPAFGAVQRQAITASIKSDIRNSVNAVLERSDSMLKFTTPEHFDAYATVTNGNSVSLFVDGDEEQVACIWGNHVFSETDVVSFYWSSETGRIGEDSCFGLDSDVVTGGYTDGTGGNPDVTPAPAPTPDSGTGADTNNPPAPPSDPSAGAIPEATTAPNEPAPAPTATPTPTPAPGSGTGAGGTTPGTGGEEPPRDVNMSSRNKFPVCHNSGTNKYNLLMLPLPAILNGHSGMSHQGGLDIIPPITEGRFAGQNWNAAGWELFKKYCM